MTQFFQTLMGKKFFEGDVREGLTVLLRLVKAVEHLAEELRVYNEAKAKAASIKKD